MSIPSRTNNPNVENVIEVTKDDKNEKRGLHEPDSVPIRTSSSAKRSDSPKLTRKTKQQPSTTKQPNLSANGDDPVPPPSPPPKINVHNSSRSTSQPPAPGSVPLKTRKKRVLESVISAVVSCCIPSPKASDESKITLQQKQQRELVELDNLRQKEEDERPTTSTSAIPEEEHELPPSVPLKESGPVPILEEPKPSVTILPEDTIEEKDLIPREETPPLLRDNDDDDEEEDELDQFMQRRGGFDRFMRESVQLQAPFPPTQDETDALVVSPTPQISVQSGTESEESDGEEIGPRPISAIFDEGQPKGPFLGPVPEHKKGRKCLILDLDECLIHSTFADSKTYDFSIAMNLEKDYGLSYIYVGKRPHLDKFLEEMGKLYEIVIFTASLQRYADPVVDIIDRDRVIDHRLFRDSCTRVWDGVQRVFLPNVKNIALLGRDLKQCIIIDNNPQCYQLHPEHAVPISSWFEDHLDVELLTMIPLLQDLARDDVEDVRDVLCQDFHDNLVLH